MARTDCRRDAQRAHGVCTLHDVQDVHDAHAAVRPHTGVNMLKQILALALAGSLAVSASASAQKTESMGTGQGGSPHEKTTWTVSGATISIAYGRPFLKGRPEAQLMPAGKPW